MAKRTRNPRPYLVPAETEDPPFSFRLNGTLITYNPANMTTLSLIESGIVQKYKEDGEPIDPPIYEVKLAGGGTQTFPHDEKTVQKSPELLELWTKHKEALARMDAEILRRKLAYTVDCVTNPLPSDDSWIERQDSYGIRLPEKPEALRRHYITTELLRTPNDNLEVFMEVTTAGLRGSLSEEDILKVREKFRRLLSVPGGNNPVVAQLIGAIDEAGRQMGSQPGADRTQNSEGLGVDAV